VNVSTSGAQANADSYAPSLSADGRFVAFSSYASNLVSGDTNGNLDVFVRDRQLGTTERVSVGPAGVQGNGNSSTLGQAISADGRYVAFESAATNLVVGDTNGYTDVFVHDRQAGTTECASVPAAGGFGNSDSFGSTISADGRFVVFESGASNLVHGDTNGFMDVFVRDRQSGTTERVSVDSAGGQGDGDSGDDGMPISSDGRFVAFASAATNLVAGDTNGASDVFVHDRSSGTTARVSVGPGGTQGSGGSGQTITSMSADGRFVAFTSSAANLVASDTNGSIDAFVHDRSSGATERASLSSSGAEPNADSTWVSISADGRFVAFQSDASNLVSGDSNATRDIFLRDRDASGFTSLCDPGVGGVSACPCSNPPGGPDRGCNNSSATGGASLAAAGVAYLSMDSLVFATAGERSTATSILLQGNALVGSGVVYGQGVRCTGGVLKRLFTKAASGGSITAPDFGAGDPTVSARSAAKGDTIQAGQSRWYLVYYRDPTVLGGCPASSTFNATQTGRVDWSL
jgi:Tol biopolymer transport system component